MDFRYAPSLAATAVVLALGTACSQEQPSESEPEISRPVPDDSTYTGAAGRKEDGEAADQSASGELPRDQTAPPPQQ